MSRLRTIVITFGTALAFSGGLFGLLIGNTPLVVAEIVSVVVLTFALVTERGPES